MFASPLHAIEFLPQQPGRTKVRRYEGHAKRAQEYGKR
jgi:hypothetical protein